MKHAVYVLSPAILAVLSLAILALAGCSTPEANPPERTELRPGYWDPR